MNIKIDDMIEINNSRRAFLGKMLTATVLTAACPHILLGKLKPEIKPGKDSVLGIFTINMSEEPYKILKEMWGSIRLQIPPDIIEGYFAPVIITHLPKAYYGKDYACLYTLCPHQGHEVKDFDYENECNECTGHGSMFRPDGTFFWGPAAQDLAKFKVTWDKGDILTIEIWAVIINVINEEFNLTYINQNVPNPCTNFTNLKYGIEKPDFVKIAIYSINGEEVLVPVNQVQDSGQYNLNINVSSLPSGSYIYKMQVGSQPPISKQIVVRR